MILVALSPILNHAVRSMSREQHRAAILILTCIFIGAPTINAFVTTGFIFAISDVNTNLTYFVTLYVVAAYIKKYDVSIAPLKGAGMSALFGLSAFALICVYSDLSDTPHCIPKRRLRQFPREQHDIHLCRGGVPVPNFQVLGDTPEQGNQFRWKADV